VLAAFVYSQSPELESRLHALLLLLLLLLLHDVSQLRKIRRVRGVAHNSVYIYAGKDCIYISNYQLSNFNFYAASASVTVQTDP
jgi:hypothetical protein